MQIIVHHDDLIQGGASIDEFARRRAEHQLGRFARHVTSISVYLADENGPKKGSGEFRVTIEAQFSHRGPVVIHHHGDDLRITYGLALDKMKRLLHDEIEKARDLPIQRTAHR
jgi:hypothetical protein